MFFCSYHVDYDQTKLSACVREFFFFGGPVEFGMALSSQKSTSKPLRVAHGPLAMPIDEELECLNMRSAPFDETSSNGRALLVDSIANSPPTPYRSIAFSYREHLLPPAFTEEGASAAPSYTW